ncbi:SDR family NAD(P)-dependent oxidoreductase [Clostridium hydrogenum]|uniref:SDR family NAD(P)-dependent oxidoreductase n=1 Tax=Clostridium hydrogenum TaxID=2855764 RepID=UPI001F1E020B|nr:SDR family NAD(P)-dependent oxidoreductase [Clostridium hydrogenum]
MKERILVTGGAGFIGTHLCKKLLEKNYDVIIYDNLSPQIHGENKQIPNWMKEKTTFIKADIRDRKSLKKAVLQADKIVHLAAETGVGQSMYEIQRYTDVTIQGTSMLWDILVNEKKHVNKVILSSSRAVYGEGKYKCSKCGDNIYPESRKIENLKQGKWEISCPMCGQKLELCATDEKSMLKTSSIYAICKKTQEEICMTMGKTLGIPCSIVRYQNVYGPLQSLNNPYTGILSIFTSRLRNNKPIQVYEDGLESRDFVHVKDVVNGTVLALESEKANYEIFNIGNGKGTTVLELAKILTKYINPNLTPVITGRYRMGDIRHCYADISKAREILGYKPRFDIETGIKDFLDWAQNEQAKDLSDNAENELKEKGLFI